MPENDDIIAPPDTQFGAPVEKVLARRDRMAARLKGDLGADRVFPQLVDALMLEIPTGGSLLEVGAGTGLLTPLLLERADLLTALEPSAAMLEILQAKTFSKDKRFTAIQGLVDDLDEREFFDNAVITFTPRRGVGLLALLTRTAGHVRHSVIVMLSETTMDWAYLARSAAIHGFDVRIHIVTGDGVGDEQKRAVLMVANVTNWTKECETGDVWEIEARVVEVPYPAPRGVATRLIRYFLAGGDRALVVRTSPKGTTRLYGNLRTAAHRLGREEITVRRTDDGVQLVRLPKVGD